ncbi:unnamed protein product [Arabidopsis halleri]
MRRLLFPFFFFKKQGRRLVFNALTIFSRFSKNGLNHPGTLSLLDLRFRDKP